MATGIACAGPACKISTSMAKEADIDKAAALPPYAAVVGSPAATNQWGLKGNTVRRTH